MIIDKIRRIYTPATLIAAFMAFGFDITVPHGFTVWLIYLIPVLFIGLTETKPRIIVADAVFTSLMIIAYIFKPGELLFISAINRIIGILGFWFVTYLIIKLRSTKEVLQESEERFLTTFENAAVGIGHLHPDGKWLRVNKKFCQMTGYSLEELQNLTYQKLTYQEDLPRDEELKNNLLTNKIKEFTLEKRYIRKDGSVFWANLICSLMKESSTNLTYFISVVEDIDYRKKVEEELQKQKDKFEDLANFNNSLLEFSPYAVGTYDEAGNCTYVNDSFCKIIGASKQEALAQNIYSIRSWKKSGLFELAVESLSEFKVITDELQMITSFEKEIWIDVRLIPFLYGGKKNLLLAFSDIAGYKSMEMQIEKQKQYAEALSEISRSLTEAELDYNVILDITAKYTHEFTGDAVGLMLLSDEKNTTDGWIYYHSNDSVIEVLKEFSFLEGNRNNSLITEVIKTEKPLLVNDFRNFDLRKINPAIIPYLSRLKTSSFMLVPLSAHDETLGLLTLIRSNENVPFSDDDFNLIQEIAYITALKLINAKLYKEKTHEADERLRTSEILEEKEALLDQILEILPVGVWFLNKNGEITRGNKEAKRIWGGAAYVGIDEFTHFKGWWAGNGKQIAPEEWAAARAILKGESSFDEVISIESFSGDRKTILNSAVPILSDNGSIKGAVVTNQDITELKRIESELIVSEERFRAMAESMPQVVWTAEPDGSLDYLNKRFEESTGVTVEDGLKWNWSPLIHPDDLEFVYDKWKFALENKTFHEVSCRVKRKEGGYRWVLTRGVPMLDSNGNVTKWIGTSTDIDAQKKAEEELNNTLKKLAESETKLLDAQKLAHVGSYMVDVEKNTVEWTEELYHICGFDPGIDAPLRGEEVYKLIHPDDADRVKEVINKSASEKIAVNVEYRIVRKDDSIRYVNNFRKPILNNKGKIVNIFGAILDITERKVIENELRFSEEKFHAMAESMPQIVWTASPNGSCDYLNKRYEEYIGIPIEKGKGCYWEKISHPDDLGYIYEVWNHALKSGEDFEAYFRVKTKDGSYRWYLTRGVAIRDKDGKIVRWIGSSTDIHNQKQTEEELNIALNKLAESETQLLDAQQLAHLGSFTIDREKNTLEWSDELFRIIGMQPGDKVPSVKELFKMVEHEDLKKIKDIFKNVYRKKISDSVEYRVKLKDGSIKYLKSIGQPILNNEETVKKVFGTVMDITEIKTFENELRASEQHFRRMAESMPQIVWTANPDGGIDYFNKRIEEYTGVPAKETYGWNWFRIIHHDDFESTFNFWKQALRSGNTHEIIHRKRNKDGNYRWFLTRALPTRDINGKIIKWIGTGTDIHDQKQAEEELNETLTKLAESEAQLIEAQKLAHVGNYILDLKTHTAEWSEEVFRIYGKDPSKRQITLEEAFKMIHPDDFERVNNTLNNAISKNLFPDVEHRIILDDGSIKHLYYNGKPIYTDEGKLIKIFGTVVDVTEQKRIEEELRTLNSNKDKFFSIISHDLKNPFSSLIGYAEFLIDEQDTLTKNEIKEFSYSIYRNAKRILNLLDNLLKWARIQTGRLEIAPSSFYIKDLFDEILPLYKPLIAKKRIGLRIKNELNEKAYADKEMIGTVLRNLLSNAIKFSHVGGKISITTSIENGNVMIKVADNGIGITAEDLNKIFKIEENLSKPGTSKESGTGLGLILCKEFIEKNNGKINVSSTFGLGTTFTVTLPSS